MNPIPTHSHRCVPSQPPQNQVPLQMDPPPPLSTIHPSTNSGLPSLCIEASTDEPCFTFMDGDDCSGVHTDLRCTTVGLRGFCDGANPNISSSGGDKDDEGHNRKLLQSPVVIHHPPVTVELPNAAAIILIPNGMRDAAGQPIWTPTSFSNLPDPTDVTRDESMEPTVPAGGVIVILAYGVVCSVE